MATPRASIPPKPLADELFECYLRTSESVYRVLHIPTFKDEYEAFWASDSQDQSLFLAMLKLVLAIGATSYDDLFSLRSSAVQWVLEAQDWLLNPQIKIESGIQSLQMEVLLLLAREHTRVRWAKTWISAGSLYRLAIYYGLNRDPARLPKKSLLATEMWRRLWNTILEINLQTCMTAGGPPLMSLDDFDTEPPGNFDDHQLLATDAVAKPEYEFTESSAAIALRKTFSVRLSIAKFLNDLGSRGGTYEETLRLDHDLKASFNALRQPFASYNTGPGLRPSEFQLDALDVIVYRYILGLHAPFIAMHLRDPKYAYSRTVVVEASLKLWSTAWPKSSVMAGGLSKATETPSSSSSSSSCNRNDMPRLILCGCGFYRFTVLLACLLLLQELKAGLHQESLGPVVLRPDLLAAVTDCKAWCLQCVKAGESNCKTYLLSALAHAEIDGLRRGLDKDALAQLLLKTLEDEEEVCLKILEERASAAELVVGDEMMALDAGSPTNADTGLWDWNFLVSYAVAFLLLYIDAKQFPDMAFDVQRNDGSLMGWV